jgi:hypothetical protein
VPLKQSKKLALACRPAAQLPAEKPGHPAGDGIGLILPFFNVPGYRWVKEPNTRSQ